MRKKVSEKRIRRGILNVICFSAHKHWKSLCSPDLLAAAGTWSSLADDRLTLWDWSDKVSRFVEMLSSKGENWQPERSHWKLPVDRQPESILGSFFFSLFQLLRLQGQELVLKFGYFYSNYDTASCCSLRCCDLSQKSEQFCPVHVKNKLDTNLSKLVNILALHQALGVLLFHATVLLCKADWTELRICLFSANEMCLH